MNHLETCAGDVVDALQIDHDPRGTRDRFGDGVTEQVCRVAPQATLEDQDLNIARPLCDEFKRPYEMAFQNDFLT